MDTIFKLKITMGQNSIKKEVGVMIFYLGTLSIHASYYVSDFAKISQRASELLSEHETKGHNSVKKYRKSNGSCSCIYSDNVLYLN